MVGKYVRATYVACLIPVGLCLVWLAGVYIAWDWHWLEHIGEWDKDDRAAVGAIAVLIGSLSGLLGDTLCDAVHGRSRLFDN